VHYPMWSEQNPGHFVALSQHIGCQDVASDAGQQDFRREEVGKCPNYPRLQPPAPH